ncbi:Transmembrane osmosensor [Malassezia sp. CBS 17886]|nr:Transmembrane osmosensor [Malassezia sp. CBS 17886]
MALGIPRLNGIASSSIMSSILLAIGAVLAIVGWFTAFVSQCVAESRHIVRGHYIWFGIFVDLFVIVIVLLFFFMGNLESALTLVIPFLVLAVTFSVLGADSGLYSNDSSAQALGAGYLLMAIAFVLWLLWFGFSHLGSGYSSGNGKTGASYGVAGAGAGAATGAGLSAGGLRNRFTGKGAGGAPGSGPISSPVENTAMPASRSGADGYGVGSTPGLGADNALYARGPEDGMAPIRGVDSAADPYGTPGGVQPEYATEPSYPPTTDATLAPAIVPGDQGSGMSPGMGGAAPGGAGLADTVVSVPPNVQRAEALYTYKASDDDPTEISFNKGDLLDIVDSSGKWWQAHRANGELGIVPSNYLKML